MIGGGGVRSLKEMLDGGRRSQSPKVHKQGMVISRSHLNISLTLKKVHLVSMLFNFISKIFNVM